jgi:hypothetical protein
VSSSNLPQFLGRPDAGKGHELLEVIYILSIVKAATDLMGPNRVRNHPAPLHWLEAPLNAPASINAIAILIIVKGCGESRAGYQRYRRSRITQAVLILATVQGGLRAGGEMVTRTRSSNE